MLQTFDSGGFAKRVGGDEVYIIWKAQNGDQAVAWAHDRHDGTYELEFVQPPIRNKQIQGQQSDHEHEIQKGKLTFFYDFSCGVLVLSRLPLRRIIRALVKCKR
jgi:hypothetical protein